MNKRAVEVVRLIEQLRRLDTGEDTSRDEGYSTGANPADEQTRPPKRIWEEMARDGEPPAQNSYDVSGCWGAQFCIS